MKGKGSAVQARSWMLQKKTKKQEQAGLIRVAMISGTVLAIAWVAKSLVWRKGTAEFEELEVKRQERLDEVSTGAAVAGAAAAASVAQRVHGAGRRARHRSERKRGRAELAPTSAAQHTYPPRLAPQLGLPAHILVRGGTKPSGQSVVPTPPHPTPAVLRPRGAEEVARGGLGHRGAACRAGGGRPLPGHRRTERVSLARPCPRPQRDRRVPCACRTLAWSNPPPEHHHQAPHV